MGYDIREINDNFLFVVDNFDSRFRSHIKRVLVSRYTAYSYDISTNSPTLLSRTFPGVNP